MDKKKELVRMTEKDALYVIDIQKGKLDLIKKKMQLDEATKSYIEKASFEYQTERALEFIGKAELLLALLEYKVSARAADAVYETSMGFDLEELIAEMVKEDLRVIAPLIISARQIADDAPSMINAYPVRCENGEVI